MMFVTIPLPRLQERREGIGLPLGELNNKNHFLFLKYTFSARLLKHKTYVASAFRANIFHFERMARSQLFEEAYTFREPIWFITTEVPSNF